MMMCNFGGSPAMLFLLNSGSDLVMGKESGGSGEEVVSYRSDKRFSPTVGAL